MRYAPSAMAMLLLGSGILFSCTTSSDSSGTQSADSTGTEDSTVIPLNEVVDISGGPKALPNLFVTRAGKTEADVKEKLTTALNRFFGIGTNEATTPTVATGYRCYYELPQDSSMAFIWSADSNDIRTEGMSYGMMLAVQTNLQSQFNRLWKFAKTYMQYRSGQSIAALNTATNAPGAAWNYYFIWQLASLDVTTNKATWSWTTSTSACPASDGEEYFAMALYLADRRWGSTSGDGYFDYKAEADKLASAMLHNTSGSTYKALFNQATGVTTAPIQVTFCPVGGAANYTDPSYHLPAFYELLSTYGPTADANTWHAIATYSRNFLISAANASTGLHPDYATFAGAATTSTSGAAASSTAGLTGTDHDTFRYDAWRVVMNLALDAAWWNSSTTAALVSDYHTFFASHHGTNNVANALWSLDGATGSGGGSTALTATLAAGAQASANDTESLFWLNSLWNVSQQKGTYRYYQECVYLLGLLIASGNFAADWQ